MVVAPQIMNPPTSSQNGPTRAAETRVRNASAAAPPEAVAVTAAGSPGALPYGRTPRSLGLSRSRQSTNGTTASAAAATPRAAGRQPYRSDTTATTGRNTSWPVAEPAVSTPDTSPRRAVNQRPVTVATRDNAIEPVPRPTSTPQHSTSCHAAVMNTVSPLPAATTTNAATTTRRTPKRSIRAAANGAVSPNSAMLIAMASEMVPTDQPNSARSGSISTPGVARNAAAPTRARKVAAATAQAGWKRRPPVPGGSGRSRSSVTPTSLASPGAGATVPGATRAVGFWPPVSA